MNVGKLLEISSAKFPFKTALVFEGKRMTFAELNERSDLLANAMLKKGLNPGDSVALLFFNSIVMVETYFAILKAKLVATPVNFRLVGSEISHILNDSGSKALFVGKEFINTIEQIKPDLETCELFVGKDALPDDFCHNHEDFLSTGKDFFPKEKITENDPCQIMYTSGTTGRPKGAVITHRSVIWNLFNTIQGREDKEGQVSIIVGPLYHTAALNNHLTIQIALGGTSVLIKKFDPETMLEIIEKEKANVVSGSPAMYNLLMQHEKAKDFDTSSVLKVTAGADKLLLETKHRLMEFFPNIKGIYDVYGCTEASPCITILKAEDSLAKNGSVGKALSFLEAKIQDEDGNVLGPNQVGEIICKGPNVMQGYHNKPKETQLTIVDGWLHTGDLAYMDEEGFFFIVDRKKDMIISGGENIYPREVEEVLYQHPDIADAAVVGVPDDLWGQSVLAFVETQKGKSLTEKAVIEFCAQRMASYKKPKFVEFIDQIPRNPSGKTLKTKLRNYKRTI